MLMVGEAQMNSDELERVKDRLQRRRREIIAASGWAATGIEELRRVERAPEPTEASQSEQLQYDLSQVGEVEQREIALIDAALARADAGEYGTCRDCGEPIELGRLAALPFGGGHGSGGEEAAADHGAPVTRSPRKPLRSVSG
jgi:RNA polymerase-binding transcription factor